MNFLLRHPAFSLSNPRTAWKTRKAMAAYRVLNPACEWDGITTKIHVHHILPIHVRPDLAADPDNFISLGAKRAHLTIGHAGDWKRYVVNVRRICQVRSLAGRNAA